MLSLHRLNHHHHFYYFLHYTYPKGPSHRAPSAAPGTWRGWAQQRVRMRHRRSWEPVDAQTLWPPWHRLRTGTRRSCAVCREAVPSLLHWKPAEFTGLWVVRMALLRGGRLCLQTCLPN